MLNEGNSLASHCSKVWGWSEKKGEEEAPIKVDFPNVGISLNKYPIYRTRLRLSAVSNCKLFNIKEHERRKELFYNLYNA